MTIQSLWTEMAIEMERASTMVEMNKTVSLRLDYMTLAHIDAIAEHLSQSRQWVLSLMLDQVLGNAVRGLADAYEKPKASAEFLMDLNETVQAKAKAMAENDGHTLDLHGWTLQTTIEPDEVQYMRKSGQKVELRSAS